MARAARPETVRLANARCDPDNGPRHVRISARTSSRKGFHCDWFKATFNRCRPLGQYVRRGRALCAERRCRYERHRSEEHTSELQSLMRHSYAVFCLKKKTLAIKKQN